MALYCNLGAREKTTSHFGRVQEPAGAGRRKLLNNPCPSTAPSREFAPNVALFLDVDGTLLEFADSPEAVFPNDGLTDILLGLEVTLGGAIALISGRTIEELDRIFDPIRLPAGGQHGLERRDAKGWLHSAPPAHALEDIRSSLREFADQNHGSLLEDKGAALALHYRMAPSLRVAAEELIVQLLVNRNDLHYLAGNMVFEIKPRSVDKGVAITRFLDEPPFAGRMPIFLGDDVTDEDGFRVVNSAGGTSIRVGRVAKSVAKYRLPNVRSVHDWLGAVLVNLNRKTK